MKLKPILTTFIAFAIVMLIVFLTPHVINHTNNLTESTQEKVIRWYIDNNKAPYKEYESYEDYVRMQNNTKSN